MEKEVRCYGCGAVLQNEDEKKIGYVPKKIDYDNPMLCKRCFRLKNYHEIPKISLTSDDFLSILHTISEKDALIVYLVDLFDFNGSMIQGLQRFFFHHDILVIGNKRDILPKSLNDRNIEHWLRRQLKEEGIKPIDVMLCSSIKNYHLDQIMDAIQQYRKGKDVYVIGTTNVGKSSFLNALLKHYSDVTSFITTSEFPGTTLNLIELPLDQNSSLYDSPGIVNNHQIAHYVSSDELKQILPQSELRPILYQLDNNQSIYIGGLARFDYVKGNHTSVGCYFSKQLKLHRTKTIHADEVYNKKLTLQPMIDHIDTIDKMNTYLFSLSNKKVDIVISGLGFFTIQSNQGKVKIYAPKGIGVFIRESLI